MEGGDHGALTKSGGRASRAFGGRPHSEGWCERAAANLNSHSELVIGASPVEVHSEAVVDQPQIFCVGGFYHALVRGHLYVTSKKTNLPQIELR